MPRLRVVLGAGLVALASASSHAEEGVLPGPTPKIVRLAGEPGRLRHSIAATLDIPTVLMDMTGGESPGEAAYSQAQGGPQPLSWFSKSNWKFYAGLILLTVAVLVLAWAF